MMFHITMELLSLVKRDIRCYGVVNQMRGGRQAHTWWPWYDACSMRGGETNMNKELLRLLEEFADKMIDIENHSGLMTTSDYQGAREAQASIYGGKILE